MLFDSGLVSIAPAPHTTIVGIQVKCCMERAYGACGVSTANDAGNSPAGDRGNIDVDLFGRQGAHDSSADARSRGRTRADDRHPVHRRLARNSSDGSEVLSGGPGDDHRADWQAVLPDGT